MGQRVMKATSIFRVMSAVSWYMERGASQQEAITNMLADLRHYCDAHQLNLGLALAMSEASFEAERKGEAL